MASIFNSTPMRKPSRNVFNLSHSFKLSTQMGRLTPIFCAETVPGDKWRGSTQMLVRMAPMIAPIMHSVNIYTHFFFVPNRLVWNEWEDFITGGPDGTSVPVFPRYRVTPLSVSQHLDLMGPGSLADYLGVGFGGSGTDNTGRDETAISALPFRAHGLIWNEYFRDQNLQDPLEIVKDSGFQVWGSPGPAQELLKLRDKAWGHDYFTSALPFSQRGPQAVIPLTGNGVIKYVGDPSSTATSQRLRSSASGTSTLNYGGPDGNKFMSAATGGQAVDVDPNGTLITDFDTVGAAVNDFRRSIRLQEWLEKNARGGARYIEQIRSHFGVTSSDSRLQRPEFLGGGKSPMVISEVLQTSSSDDITPQANMSGHGISAHGSHMWNKFIEEHGYIIGFMSVIPKTGYQQGIPRHFQKFDKFDYYFPEFANLGEQEVWNSEIYANLTDASNWRGVFGYVPRYAEYKFCADRAAGDFKTDSEHSLDFWHMIRYFTEAPVLNGEFVSGSTATQRIYAVTEEEYDKLWCLVQNSVKAVRPMPRFGVPTI